MLSEIFLEQPSPLYIHAFTNNWSLSYPVCVQLCLHCRDVAPYRLLLLQLLTFKPQPVQELLQRHVEPFPRGHLWVQVGPSNTNTLALSKLFHTILWKNPQPSLTSCWGSCCAGHSSAGSCCPDVSGAELPPPSPPARSRSSGRSHPGSDTALCGCRSLPEGPGKKHAVRVGGKSVSALWISHFIFLVTAVIFQEFTFSLLEWWDQDVREWFTL